MMSEDWHSAAPEARLTSLKMLTCCFILPINVINAASIFLARNLQKNSQCYILSFGHNACAAEESDRSSSGQEVTLLAAVSVNINMSKKCKACDKAVYPQDPQVNLDGTLLHKECAKCGDCKCQITIVNFCKNESVSGEFVLLCKVHYFKRFHEGGSYLGGDKFNVKNTRDFKDGTAIGTPTSPSPAATPAASLTAFSVDQLVKELEGRGYVVALSPPGASTPPYAPGYNSLPHPAPAPAPAPAVEPADLPPPVPTEAAPVEGVEELSLNAEAVK